MKTDPVLTQLAALKAASIAEIKAQWRDLFCEEPPAFNRRYLESRLAYRVQELAYGGLKPATVKRLQQLGEHPVFQHYHQHGPADAQRPAVICPVRARGHR